MKAIEQYFHVLLFIMLHKVVLTFKSVDETFVCDQSNGATCIEVSCGNNYFAVQGGSNLNCNCQMKSLMTLSANLY